MIFQTYKMGSVIIVVGSMMTFKRGIVLQMTVPPTLRDNLLRTSTVPLPNIIPATGKIVGFLALAIGAASASYWFASLVVRRYRREEMEEPPYEGL